MTAPEVLTADEKAMLTEAVYGDTPDAWGTRAGYVFSTVERILAARAGVVTEPMEHQPCWRSECFRACAYPDVCTAPVTTEGEYRVPTEEEVAAEHGFCVHGVDLRDPDSCKECWS